MEEIRRNEGRKGGGLVFGLTKLDEMVVLWNGVDMSESILTASIVGLDAHPVRVEADISPGLSAFIVVGLPDAAVQEARERVRSAMKQSELPFPRTRVVVNLAPADVKKSGTPFDVAIALAIMVAQGDLPGTLPARTMFVGELGLDGSVRPVHGVLAVATLAQQLDVEELVVSRELRCDNLLAALWKRMRPTPTAKRSESRRPVWRRPKATRLQTPTHFSSWPCSSAGRR